MVLWRTIIDLNQFCSQLTQASGQAVDAQDPKSLVGVFQRLRPDPAPLQESFEMLPNGAEVYQRLRLVYHFAGNPRRSDGMKDAFFVVRFPSEFEPEQINLAGKQFFDALGALAHEQGKQDLADRLAAGPQIRLLEGAAPKHPKADEEKSGLMKAVLETGPTITEELISRNSWSRLLSRATYFLACDAFLRDFVLWPLLKEYSALDDPFRHYLELWKHGIKIRIFGDRQIDLYAPR